MDAQSPTPPPAREARSASCEQHGAFASHRLFGSIWSRCPACVSDEAKLDAERERHEHVRRAREAREERLAQSGLEPRFLGCTFETYVAKLPQQEAARTACRDFVQGLSARCGGALWLVGPPGTGKTHLGSAMVNQVIQQQNAWAAIHPARDIVRMLRSAWGRREGQGRTELEILQHLGSIQLLVIDEIGVGFGSDAETLQLFDVIDERYRREMPTVVISNLPAKQIAAVIGDRAADRLSEDAKFVACNWQSHRAWG